MEIEHPAFLLLLVPLAGLLIFGLRRSLARLGGGRRIAATVLRALILLLLVLALSGVRWLRSDDSLGVLFLIDCSQSVGDAARAEAGAFLAAASGVRPSSDTQGAVAFAQDPFLIRGPEASPLPAGIPWPPDADRAATATAKALRFAAALFPSGQNRRIVLLSDGNDTGGEAAGAAAVLAAGGITIDTVALRTPFQPEVLVRALEAPASLKSGEAFNLTARVLANSETTAAARLYRDQFLVAEQQVRITNGENTITFPGEQADRTFTRYEVELVPQDDTLIENNRAQAAVFSRGKPRVLAIDRDPQSLEALSSALESENIDVTARAVSGLPRSLDDLQQFDLLVLSDVSALDLNARQMDLYRQWVGEFGGGFIMAGGENSFGAGGWFRTPVEAMLPVRVEHEDRQESPTVALLVVLDRSGSMAATVESGETKMSLANQGAVYALEVLGDRDYFGLFAVDSEVHQVVPLNRVAGTGASSQRILSITAGGGGIYIYTSLEEAFRMLRNVNAKIRHVIVFSDAADAEEKVAGEMGGGRGPTGASSLDLASAMMANRITTSVVALGNESDRDTAFLRLLAERGNGRFYLTSDPLSLPQIFTTETMKVAQSSLVEEPVQVVATAPSPATAGIDWAAAPLLLGYNSVKPKPAAEIPLASEFGEPILARWRFGLGQTAAFTSDAKNRWATGWIGWDGFGKFWTQLVRATMRQGNPNPFEFSTRETPGGGLDLQIDAADAQGAFRNELPMQVVRADEDGTTSTARAGQTAPGRYLASFQLAGEGSFLFSITTGVPGEPPATFGYTRSYPAEFLGMGTNEDALRAIANAGGGRFNPAPDEIFAHSQPPAIHPLDLTPWLLALALLLVPADIAIRRSAGWKSSG